MIYVVVLGFFREETFHLLAIFILIKEFSTRVQELNLRLINYCQIIISISLPVLKDEPDDLTHLAPTAGDGCIALEETAPFFHDMFDDFIIPDNYNTLLTDELNSLDSQCSKSTNSSSNNDPFINYRDEANETSHSPHLLSPGLSKVCFLWSICQKLKSECSLPLIACEHLTITLIMQHWICLVRKFRKILNCQLNYFCL